MILALLHFAHAQLVEVGGFWLWSREQRTTHTPYLWVGLARRPLWFVLALSLTAAPLGVAGLVAGFPDSSPKDQAGIFWLSFVFVLLFGIRFVAGWTGARKRGWGGGR